MAEYILSENLDKIELSSNPSILDFNGPCLRFGVGSKDSIEGDFSLVSETDYFGLRGFLAANFQYAIDDGDWVTVIGGNITTPEIIASGLGAGLHLLRVIQTGGNAYLNSVYCDNPPVSVAAAQNTYFPSTSSALSNGEIFVEGNAHTDGTDGRAATKTFPGVTVEFGFDGTDVEEFGFDGRQWGVSFDGAFADFVVQDNSGQNYRPMGSIADGIHTAQMINSGAGGNAFRFSVRILKASHVTTPSDASDSVIAVDQTDFISVGDWVWIDYFANREWRQVSAKTTTSLTFSSPLDNAHSAGCVIRSYCAPAGAITAWQSRATPTKTIAVIGDSNTEAANYYGGAEVPDANGVYYSGYDYRWGSGFIFSRLAGWDYLDLGLAGTTSADMVTRAAAIAAYRPAGVDVVGIFDGTNDVNGTSRTSEQYEATQFELIDSAAAVLKTGGRVLCMPISTPTNVVANPGGLSVAGCNAIKQSCAESSEIYSGDGPMNGQPYNSFCTYVSTLFNGMDLTAYNEVTNPTGDLDGVLHYWPTGLQKMATNLRNLLAPAPSGNALLVIDALNQIAEAIGATAGHTSNPVALSAIATELTGQAFSSPYNLDAYNAIAGHYLGSPQSFRYNLDALNAIVADLTGESSNHVLIIDALNAWIGEL